jgi:hypothetical protein
VRFVRPALILSLALTLPMLGATPAPAAQPADLLPILRTSTLPVATIGLHHPPSDHAPGSTEAQVCDKDIDLTSAIAGVTAIAAQDNGICTSADIDVYEQAGSLYVVQAGGEEAAFTITRIAANGTPTLIDQKPWQQTNTYTPDVKAFRQGNSRYIALSLERLAPANAACGVVIVDVTNAPITPIVDQVFGSDWCDVHNSFVENDANGDGRYIYLTADAPRDMRVLDIGNLSNITEIGRYTHPQAGNDNFVHDVTVIDHGGAIGRRVYVSYWDAGLMILDADHVTPGVIQAGSPNQPLNPNHSIDPSGFSTHHAYPSPDGSRVFVQDEVLNTAGTQPVQMWNISSPGSPSYVAGISLGSSLMPVVNPAHNLLVQGHCLYVGWYKAGLQVFQYTDVGFTSRPMHHQAQTEVADDQYDGAWGARVATRDSLALVFQSDRRYGLIIDSINSNLDSDGDSFGDVSELRLTTDSCLACAVTPTADDESPDPYPLDTNDDGFTDITDIATVGGFFGKAQTPSNVRYDLNLDGFIDISDIVLIGSRFGKACIPPGPLG